MAGVLILGGRSDIGGEIARRVAPGQDIVLAARGTHGMEAVSYTHLTLPTICSV